MIGWNDHHFLRSSRTSSQLRTAFLKLVSVGSVWRGSGAPKLTHFVKSAMTLSTNLGALSGIFSTPT